ncbi:efflux RND transporter periplasmic adaptor subunit [Effusibacillus lacus]|uniref:Hemolysin D n=1 Tax=Effusibacillus lacus TaxID=1348429 RepID=A0A292YU62_9BACL|nr:efflux RND transporter periplasmic adaptor subunit [Effusibacillus lacus]TCS73754.1 HlyD family secretion protein [Effusibacillus lacus]GAX92035.1 hemolysin D [Effusibacillus lacus]
MKRKIILLVLLAVMLGSGAGIGYYYWYQEAHYVKTEDARIAGDIYRVMPRIAGKLTQFGIKEGDAVGKDQIVGQQDIGNLPNSMLENAVLRSPVEGTVIKTLAHVGEVVSPGQTVAMVVNKKNLYVSANIEETDLQKVQTGQYAEFTVDSFPGHTFNGKVAEIGEATASTFALLPAMNTSGNFTKVTQRVPIKIAIENPQGVRLSPGMSAVVKIHLKAR